MIGKPMEGGNFLMKNFWKIVMLTVLCVSLLCGVTAMAEADRFQIGRAHV